MKTSFDPLAQRYSSPRFPVYARGGMVNASSPQALDAPRWQWLRDGDD